MKIAAQFYPEGGSNCLAAEVLLNASGTLLLVIEQDNLRFERPRDELQIKGKLGSIPREVILREVGLLSLPSTTEIDDWLDANKHKHSVSNLEASRSVVLLSLVLVPAFLFVFFKYFIPGFAVHFSEYVPQAAIDIASEHTLFTLDKTLLDETELDVELQVSIQQKWQDTLEQLQLGGVQYNLNFRSSSKMGANAFALPDGTVVVTDELLALLDNNADLLQAILLHEIGHVERKHSMRLISETLATSLAIDYFFGDLGGMIEMFAGISNAMVQNQFSQKLEWEADNFALLQLDALGLKKESFALAMEKLAETLPEQSKLDVFLQSHPMMKERILNARSGKTVDSKLVDSR